MLNLSTHGHSRFQGKLDKIFWFFVLVLPLVFWLMLNIGRAFVPAKAEGNEDTPIEPPAYTYQDYTYCLTVSSDSLTVYVSEGIAGDIFQMNFVPVDFGGNEPLQLSFRLDVGELIDTVIGCTSNGYDNGVVSAIPMGQQTINVTVSAELFDSVEWLNDKVSINEWNQVPNVPPEESLSVVFSNLVYLERTLVAPVVVEEVIVDSVSETDFVSMNTIMVDFFGMDINAAPVSMVAEVYNNIFGVDGIFPFFQDNSGFMYYFVYFVYIQVIHVLVDVLVFVPRFAHKILDKAVNFGE